MELDERYKKGKPKNQNRLAQAFWVLALVRYATFKQLKKCNFSSVGQHIFIKKDLQFLLQLEYLGQANGFYFPRKKAFDHMREHGIITDNLQQRHRAEPDIHQSKLTEYIITEINRDDFYFVFYPQFQIGLIPDACIIYRNDTGYKIEFIEAENPKVDWENYILEKEEKYKRLASDPDTFRWWKTWSFKLGLTLCNINDFCFWWRVIK